MDKEPTLLRIGPTLSPVYTDGPGARSSVYFQGCRIRCPGCQNPHLFKRDGGTETTPEAVAAELGAKGLPVSILGGEPFDQPEALAMLILALRNYPATQPVIVYTGYTWEQLLQRAKDDEWVACAMKFPATIVDGPYVQGDDDDFVQWRGSRNQRPIDVEMTWTLNYGYPVIVRDWDTPTLTITPEGDIIGAAGVMIDLFPGESDESRRCGQTREG